MYAPPALQWNCKDNNHCGSHDDFQLEPHARDQCRTRRVLLQPHVMPAQVIDEIPSRDLVDRPGAILPKTIRFGPPPVEVLVNITARVIVDLDLKPGDHGTPSWIAGNFLRVRS